jgi:hypothetical protein
VNLTYSQLGKHKQNAWYEHRVKIFPCVWSYVYLNAPMNNLAISIFIFSINVSVYCVCFMYGLYWLFALKASIAKLFSLGKWYRYITHKCKVTTCFQPLKAKTDHYSTQPSASVINVIYATLYARDVNHVISLLFIM